MNAIILDYKKDDMKRIIVSGGGTGGHIFPALSIANALKRMDKDVEILFVGAEGKMEMEKVPEAGFPIEGLPVRGLQRRLTLENVKVLINLWKSLRKAKKIIRRFRPDVVVGGRRLCQWPDRAGSCECGHPFGVAGTEFLCRCD